MEIQPEILSKNFWLNFEMAEFGRCLSFNESQFMIIHLLDTKTNLYNIVIEG